MTVYKRTRVRGLADWKPRAETLQLIDQVLLVLDEYADHLPLTIRQIFYRLVAKFLYPKDEQAAARLYEHLNRARRAGLIPFAAIRDDGATTSRPLEFDGLGDFWARIGRQASRYQRRRLEGEEVVPEIWVEAAGMVPQVARVAHQYGVSVFSSGGFDSVTVKYEAAERFVDRDRPTCVLHIVDHDASGLSVFDSASGDISQMVRDMGRPGVVDFARVAVTPEQIEHFQLPSAPAKDSDRRGSWSGGTVQAEALAPPDLAAAVDAALRELLDSSVLEAVIAQEEEERLDLIAQVEAARQ